MAEVGIEPPTSRYGVRDSTTRPPRSPHLVKNKSACITTEDDKRLEISDLGSREIVICTIYVAKTTKLISCVVTMRLICAFVFIFVEKQVITAKLLVSKNLIQSLQYVMSCHVSDNKLYYQDSKNKNPSLIKKSK